jgi:hypothetical protein
MFRKVTLGLIAAAALGAAALAPGSASAHGFHGGGWGGWHGGWGHGFYGSTVYVGGVTDDCLQQRMVETRRGMRLRTVNVCVNAY